MLSFIGKIVLLFDRFSRFYKVIKPYLAQWSKDGNPINLKDLPLKYEVGRRKHILIIKSLKFEDKGNYTCIVGWRQPSSGMCHEIQHSWYLATTLRYAP